MSAASHRRLKALAARSGRTLAEVLDQLIALAATHPAVAALLADAGLADLDAGHPPLLAFDDGRPPRPRPLVMVVEDDPASLDLMKVRLEFMGCDVLAADGPDEAFALARDERPGLVVVDLALGAEPTGGLRLIQLLREHEETARIPIAIHSVFVRHPDDLPRPLPRVEALLPKPFKFKQLRDLVADHYRDTARGTTQVRLL